MVAVNVVVCTNVPLTVSPFTRERLVLCPGLPRWSSRPLAEYKACSEALVVLGCFHWQLRCQDNYWTFMSSSFNPFPKKKTRIKLLSYVVMLKGWGLMVRSLVGPGVQQIRASAPGIPVPPSAEWAPRPSDNGGGSPRFSGHVRLPQSNTHTRYINRPVFFITTLHRLDQLFARLYDWICNLSTRDKHMDFHLCPTAF